MDDFTVQNNKTCWMIDLRLNGEAVVFESDTQTFFDLVVRSKNRSTLPLYYHDQEVAMESAEVLNAWMGDVLGIYAKGGNND